MRKLLQKYKNLKYRYKLTVIMILCSLIPAAVISAYTLLRTVDMMREKEKDTLQQVVNQSMESIENKAEIYGNLLHYLAYSSDLRRIMEKQYESDYEAYLEYTETADPLLTMPQLYHEEIRGITLYASNIQVEHGSTLAPLSTAQSQQWYAQIYPQDTIQWIVRQGNPKEILAVRKFYKQEEIHALLVITLDYDKLLEPFASVLENNQGGLITDEEGNVIFSGRDMEPSLTPEKKTFLISLTEHYVCTEARAETTGWNFCFYQSQQVIDAAVANLMWGNVPVLAGCLVLIFLLGYFFSRGMVARLEQLTENMNQINLGLRQVTVVSDSKDEIGVLIRTFRRMMNEINKLISQVYEAKIHLQKTEMQALQAQINPHFLYNSLSIINWKAIEAGNDEISQVTLALSTYYRPSLNKGETMTIAANELRNIEAYLHIQLVMHDDSFQVEKQVEEKILSCSVPKLILQPLVENAIEHGLDVSEKEEKKLKISALLEGGDLVFFVEDNGAGMEEEQAESMLTYQSKGYGMRNVHDRIRLLYGEESGLKIYSKKGEGTRVEIRFPADREEHTYE